MHGTAVAVGPRAVLLRGPPGAGKSDVALRMIALPPFPPSTDRAVLVADDRTRLSRTGVYLDVAAPATIAGLIEVRGVGLVRLPYRPVAQLALVVDLVPPGTPIERMPESADVTWLGVSVPRISLDARAPSAAVQVLVALATIWHEGHP